MGAFQTKGHWRTGAAGPEGNLPHWREAARLDLIRRAARRLRAHLGTRPGQRAHLAFPGIGLGGLEPGAVLGVLEGELEPVADRVVLYRR